MLVRDLFQKDIARPINGVVKADQLDALSVWQELDEFVVTNELDKHFRTFYSNFVESLSRAGDPDIAGKNGVWVSGFFGCGKSHFIKVLSYLLKNDHHTFKERVRPAVEFFDSKIRDAMLLGEIKQAAASLPDIILFNIDTKADHTKGRDAILQVFMKVFNEHVGYSSHFPHIARLERYLESTDRLQAFHREYLAETGEEWVEKRDVYDFNQDQVVIALTRTIDQTEESCRKWIDSAADDYSLTVDHFARCVRDYLKGKGEDHRIVFLIDEVGQFIGDDVHMMLNLQTITEQLGTVCGGRAWIVVTSQEDIDATLGGVITSKAHDFSKIQGRFRTRLSLSSANVDEVIQKRLLAKREVVKEHLKKEYVAGGDILRNHLTFRDAGMTMATPDNEEDFTLNYPVIPYQFKLLQKIFESIRKAGATGMHLARGERSLLDAFQVAIQSVANREIGVLVPLYRFYPAIENFLDTAVKRTIDHAAEDPNLQGFDSTLLKVLFLIRYVDEIKGNVDTLVALCIDNIDAPRLALKHRIEEGLQRLEQKTLVNRNGDVYFFLTKEERDIINEIKKTEIDSDDEINFLSKAIFDGVFSGKKKHRYNANNKDFPFHRMCGGHPFGSRADGDLIVSVMTPYNDSYEEYEDVARCIYKSAEYEGIIFIRMADDRNLGNELKYYLQTEKYLTTRTRGTMAPTTKTILRELKDENRQRGDQLTELLRQELIDGSYYVSGSKLETPRKDPVPILEYALDYLIQNTFTKMDLLDQPSSDPIKDLQALLNRPHDRQTSLAPSIPARNMQAIEDVGDHINLSTRANKRILLTDLLERYERRPYGWPEYQVMLLLVRLYSEDAVRFIEQGTPLRRDQVSDALLGSRKRRKTITVRQTQRVDREIIEEARTLGREIFLEMGPDGEEALVEFLRDGLSEWQSTLVGFRDLVQVGRFPGGKEITHGIVLLSKLLAPAGNYRFLSRFVGRKDGTEQPDGEHATKVELKKFANDYREIQGFHQHQRSVWDKLRVALGQFEQNQRELEQDENAGPALAHLREIFAADKPYGFLQEVDGHILTVETVNDRLVDAQRTNVEEAVRNEETRIQDEIAKANPNEQQVIEIQKRVAQLKERLTSQRSLAHLEQTKAEAESLRRWANEQLLRGQFCTISPKSIVTSPYLTSEEDVDRFINELRSQLEQALKDGKQIEIV